MSLGKSFARWNQTMEWCKVHPGKVAAIVTPEGQYRISFMRHSDLLGVDHVPAMEGTPAVDVQPEPTPRVADVEDTTG